MKLSNHKANSFVFTIVFFVFYASFLNAQLNMPFSALGVGESASNTNAVNTAMGGIRAADYSYYYINHTNPASYGFAQNTNYRKVIFDMGLQIQQQQLTKKTIAVTNDYIYLSSLNFSVPLYKNLGLVFGYQPLHLTSYLLEKKIQSTILDTAGIYVKSSGNGTLYQFFFGVGHHYKGFAYGLNIGYLSGNKLEEYNTIGASDASLQKVGTNTKNTYGGLLLEGGLLYEKELYKNATNQEALLFQVGLTAKVPTNISQKEEKINRNFTFLSDGTTTALDTLSQTNQSGQLNYPALLEAGIIIKKQDNWKLGIDYAYQQWSALTSLGKQQNFIDQSTIKMGYEIIPNAKSSNYFSQIPYRFGFQIGNFYAKNNGQTLYPFTISAGVGLFIKKYSYSLQSTVINLAFEYQQRGTQTDAFYENFYNIKIGFALSDLWFRKQKFF